MFLRSSSTTVRQWADVREDEALTVMAKAQQQKEKRAHRRLAVRLPLVYRRADSPWANGSTMSTVNVSTGGVYFETTDEDMQPGDALALEFNVPEGDDRFPPHSTITTIGRVVRTEVLDGGDDGGDGVPFRRLGIGAQFEGGLKLVF